MLSKTHSFKGPFWGLFFLSVIAYGISIQAFGLC